MKEPIAVRILTSVDNAASISLELYGPERAAEDRPEKFVVNGEWVCEFRIVQGASVVAHDLATGSDALEAIVNAISRLRAQFRWSGLSAFWNEHLDGCGLPPYLPQGFGLEFDRYLERL